MQLDFKNFQNFSKVFKKILIFVIKIKFKKY